MTSLTPTLGKKEALETLIDGALCKLRIDQTSGAISVLYQPRNEQNEALWAMWSRDCFYDGWTFDKVWATPEEADYLTQNFKRFEPEFDDKPVGWSPLQIGQATTWAIQAEAEYARSVAGRFAYRSAAE